jgi:rhomboid protease GluP
MAFGFSPKHIREIELDGLKKEHFLVLAIEAAQKMEWNVSFVSETGFIAYTKFSFSSYGEEVTVKIDGTTVNIKSECTGSQIADWGKNKHNIEDLLSAIDKAKTALTEEDIKDKLSALQQTFVPKEEDVLSQPPLTTKQKITSFFSIFVPTKGFFISPILIDINILIFILMLFSGVHFLMPENQSLLDWGANFRPVTLDGQWWRLFTCCFLHIGVLHLLLNMYALLYIGVLLEPYLGKTRFLASYLLSGIAASVASLWWNDLTISAGASGAIFGMYGVFLAMLTTNLLDKSVKKSLLISIGIFVFYNLVNGLKPDSGIDNAAHIGGLLSGLIIGYAFIPSLKKYDNKVIKFGTITVLTVVLLISTSFVYRNVPNDFGKYQQTMNDFAKNETEALKVYQLFQYESDVETILRSINEGIDCWNKNLKLIDSLNDLDLPDEAKSRNMVLKEYCELRIGCYNLMQRAIAEDTDAYDSEFERYNQKIEAIITQLTGE